jgi:chemotaxis protein methyltransferase CheR
LLVFSTGDALMISGLEYNDFDRLRCLINEASGIELEDHKVVFLRSRLSERMRACNISTPREYYYFLKYDPGGGAELARLLDLVAIHETWFFREIAPLRAWCTGVWPQLRTRSEKVVVWSAGCSSGEEPYTLAMLLDEIEPAGGVPPVRIVGSDLSARVLAAAQTGVYDVYSLRHTEDRHKTTYFKPTVGGQMELSPVIRQRVTFKQANLLEDQPVNPGTCDLVICRNVLIYLDQKSRGQLLGKLAGALRGGGYLILGHAESPVPARAPLVLARVEGAILYQKPAEK